MAKNDREPSFNVAKNDREPSFNVAKNNDNSYAFTHYYQRTHKVRRIVNVNLIGSDRYDRRRKSGGAILICSALDLFDGGACAASSAKRLHIRRRSGGVRLHSTSYHPCPSLHSPPTTHRKASRNSSLVHELWQKRPTLRQASAPGQSPGLRACDSLRAAFASSFYSKRSAGFVSPSARARSCSGLVPIDQGAWTRRAQKKIRPGLDGTRDPPHQAWPAHPHQAPRGRGKVERGYPLIKACRPLLRV